MSSEEMGIGPSHSHSHSHSHSNHLLFQDEAMPLRFNCAAPQRPKTTRELTGFIDDKLFFTPPHGPQFRRTHWNDDGGAATPSADDSDDEDDVDEDDDEVDEGEVERLVNGVGVGVGVDDSNNNHDDTNTGNKIDRNSNATADNGGTDRMGNGKAKHHHSTFGSSSSREVLVGKDGNVGQSLNHATSDSHNHHHHHHQQQQGRLRVGGYQNAVTIAEPDGDLYYSQYLDGSSGLAASSSGHKDVVAVVDNGCGFSGRKDVSVSSESGESLRAILSDPVTGALMDDAMILPCGHSFGGGGIQHVTRVKSCYTCSQSISEDSIAPNLSLRAAVQAFRREEELLLYRSSKRRRERFDQDKGGFGDSALMDPSRGRGVQFPFAVTDRVIIKGNKRTPQRFVGREAIVTTQCLNGWYVVKTLDNAESVKLQYRSLAKVSDDPSMKPMSSKIAPNWL